MRGILFRREAPPFELSLKRAFTMKGREVRYSNRREGIDLGYLGWEM